MPDRAEILRSLYGAYLLARGDVSGMNHFDLTVEGFWRSFFAALLAAPAYVIVVAHEWRALETSDGLGRLTLVEILTYAGLWTVFPLVAVGLTRAFDLSRGYVPLIVAGNWAAVLHSAAFAVVVILAVALPVVGGILGFVLLPAVLVYQWFVIRTALQTTTTVAVMFLLIDLVLSLIVQSMADSLI